VIVWILLLMLAITGCTGSEHLTPALPDEKVVFTPVQAQTPIPEPEPVASQVPVSAVPVITPLPSEWVTNPKPGSKLAPEKIIRSANTQALMEPSLEGYKDGRSVIQRYPYVSGQLYQIYSSPRHPTTIVFPPGEYLAIDPDIDTETESGWVVNTGEMGEGTTYQQFIKIRPLKAGIDDTTTFVMQSGMLIACQLKSFAKTSMVVVTWEVSRPRLAGGISTPRPRAAMVHSRQREQDATPKVDPTRLHTAYTIEATKGNPPWVPLSVYDDGTKTVIKFKETLGYTQAPAPFAIDAEGKTNLVQFIPYQVPNEASKGTYYLIQGLFPKLELKGDGGMVVTITRQTGQPAPYQAVKEPTS